MHDLHALLSRCKTLKSQNLIREIRQRGLDQNFENSDRTRRLREWLRREITERGLSETL